MTPIKTAACNFTYTAPAGVSPDKCGDLPCLRTKDSTTSWWQPDEQERLALASGAAIQFTAIMPTHPMIHLQTVQMIPLPEQAGPALTASDITSLLIHWNLAMQGRAELLDAADMDQLRRLPLSLMLHAVHQVATTQSPSQEMLALLPNEIQIAAIYTFLHHDLIGTSSLIHDGRHVLMMVPKNVQNLIP